MNSPAEPWKGVSVKRTGVLRRAELGYIPRLAESPIRI